MEMAALRKRPWTHTPPSVFDIVTSYFPERTGEPSLKLRPSLVLAVLQEENTGAFACHVAFGTKNLKLLQRQHLDLVVQNFRDLDHLGLHRATRFDLDQKVTLPWTEEFFGCWEGQSTPVIGALTENYLRDYAFLMLRREAMRQTEQ